MAQACPIFDGDGQSEKAITQRAIGDKDCVSKATGGQRRWRM